MFYQVYSSLIGIGLLSLMIDLNSCDYQKMGVLGPDSIFFLKNVDYKLVGPSESQNFIVKSLKVKEDGKTKLTLKVKSKKVKIA